MKKIPTLFVRDLKTHLVINEINPGCEWVVAGEGQATSKLDGTCCMIRDGKLYRRHEVRHRGNPKDGWQPFLNYPDGWELATNMDMATGKEQGWVPVGDDPEDKYHREAIASAGDCWPLSDGTYELLGPKVQGNPEQVRVHTLRPHGAELLPEVPRDFDGLREWLATHDVEGIVWHHPDGRMAKIKGKDFGLRRVKQ